MPEKETGNASYSQTYCFQENGQMETVDTLARREKNTAHTERAVYFQLLLIFTIHPNNEMRIFLRAKSVFINYRQQLYPVFFNNFFPDPLYSGQILTTGGQRIGYPQQCFLL